MTSPDSGDVNPVIVGIILFLCVVALALNILVIVVIAKRGNLRSSVDIFLINLAVSDSLLAGIVYPLHFKNVFLDDGQFYGGNPVCKLIMFIPKFIIMSAISTIVAIAADRYRVMIYQKILFRRGALISIGIIWLTAACFSAPQVYEYNIYETTDSEYNRTLVVCGSEGIVEHFETVYASIFLLAYFVSFVMLTVFYSRISCVVWKHARRFRSAQQEFPDETDITNNGGRRLEERISARKMKVLKMLVSITVSFVALWTPYFILFAMQEILDMDHTSEFDKWPHITTRTMSVISTITNPVLYLVFSDKVRQFLDDAAHCRWPKGDDIGRSASQVSTTMDRI